MDWKDRWNCGKFYQYIEELLAGFWMAGKLDSMVDG